MRGAENSTQQQEWGMVELTVNDPSTTGSSSANTATTRCTPTEACPDA
jgi:hypothetical protein